MRQTLTRWIPRGEPRHALLWRACASAPGIFARRCAHGEATSGWETYTCDKGHQHRRLADLSVSKTKSKSVTGGTTFRVNAETDRSTIVNKHAG